MGIIPESVETGVWEFYLLSAIILLGLAFVGRKWQIKKG